MNGYDLLGLSQHKMPTWKTINGYRKFQSTKYMLEYMIDDETQYYSNMPYFETSKVAMNEIPYEAYSGVWETKGKFNNFGYFWDLPQIHERLRRSYKIEQADIDTRLIIALLYDLDNFDKTAVISEYNSQKLQGYLETLEDYITRVVLWYTDRNFKDSYRYDYSEHPEAKDRIVDRTKKFADAMKYGEESGQFWGGNGYIRRIILIVLLVIAIVVTIVSIVCISVKICAEKNKNNII
jgi:hypothetical protein